MPLEWMMFEVFCSKLTSSMASNGQDFLPAPAAFGIPHLNMLDLQSLYLLAVSQSDRYPAGQDAWGHCHKTGYSKLGSVAPKSSHDFTLTSALISALGQLATFSQAGFFRAVLQKLLCNIVISKKEL